MNINRSLFNLEKCQIWAMFIPVGAVLLRGKLMHITDITNGVARMDRRRTERDSTSVKGARFLEGLESCFPKKFLISRVFKLLLLAFSGRFIDNLRATHQ